MANPYRAQAKSTSASKFKAISGKSSSGKPFDASPENSDRMAASYKSTRTSGADVSPSGKTTKRLDKYARGGAVGKKGTNITINIVGKPGEDKPPMPLPLPIPMGGPPPGPPPMEPPPPGPIPGPGPMMRKAGGRVNKANGGAAEKGHPNEGLTRRPPPKSESVPTAQTGGRVKMTGGADTGVGRLDKAKAYKRG